MIARTVLGLATILFVPGSGFAADPTPESLQVTPEVHWYRFDDGLLAARDAEKHIMVDVYTDWCGFCKKLDRETYSDATVRKVLSESYVSVKLKGDSGARLKLRGQPLSDGGKTRLQIVPTDEPQIAERDLSRYQLRGTGFPTIVFFSSDGRMITSISGFRDAGSLMHILNFIKDDLYEVMSFQDYLKSLEKITESAKDRS